MMSLASMGMPSRPASPGSRPRGASAGETRHRPSDALARASSPGGLHESVNEQLIGPSNVKSRGGEGAAWDSLCALPLRSEASAFACTLTFMVLATGVLTLELAGLGDMCLWTRHIVPTTVDRATCAVFSAAAAFGILVSALSMALCATSFHNHVGRLVFCSCVAMWLAISAIRGVMGWSSAAVASHVAQSVPIPDEPSLVLPHVLGRQFVVGFCQALTLVACAPNRSFQQDLRFVAWIGASAALRAAAASVQLFSPLFQPALHSTSHAVGGTALTVASSAAGLLLAFFLLRPAWLGRAWDADDARPAHRRGTGVPSALAWLGIQGLKHATWTVLTLATVVIACAEYAGVRLEPWAALLLLLAVVSTFRVSVSAHAVSTQRLLSSMISSEGAQAMLHVADNMARLEMSVSRLPRPSPVASAPACTSLADHVLQVVTAPALGPPVRLQDKENVTVVFTDIVHFTAMAGQCDPGEVFQIVNEYFLKLDRALAPWGVFKYQTVGDAYLVISNYYGDDKDHASTALLAAIAMVKVASTIRRPRPRASRLAWTDTTAESGPRRALFAPLVDPEGSSGEGCDGTAVVAAGTGRRVLGCGSAKPGGTRWGSSATGATVDQEAVASPRPHGNSDSLVRMPSPASRGRRSDDGSAVLRRHAPATVPAPPGAPRPLGDPGEEAVACSEDHLAIRVGIHSGSLAAGILGQSRQALTLIGDTMNVASRMETTSQPNHVRMTQATWELLTPEAQSVFSLELVQAKGKGNIATYIMNALDEGAVTKCGFYSAKLLPRQERRATRFQRSAKEPLRESGEVPGSPGKFRRWSNRGDGATRSPKAEEKTAAEPTPLSRVTSLA